MMGDSVHRIYFIIVLELISFPVSSGNHALMNSRIRKDTDIANDNICNRDKFDSLRINSQWKATEDYLKSLRKSCTKKYRNKSCDGGVFPSDNPSLTVRRDERTKKEYVKINMFNVNNNTDCWMFAFIAKSSSIPREIKIDFYEFRGDTVKIKFHYKPAFNYTFQIIALPTGHAKVFNRWVAPGRCEMEVMYDIQAKETYDLCSRKNLFHEDLMREASRLCDGALSTYARRARVRNELKIIDCQLKYIKKVEPKEEVDQLVVVIVVVAIGLLVVSGSLVVVFFFKRKKRDMSDDRWGTEIEQLNKNTGPPSVMIVHRPGCEHLDQFVQQFSSLLMSYNIKVKTTFDGCDLSAEGGIASYMQRNIQKCDFVLIFITEKTGEKPLLKHRPFEFSLKLMEGIAIHEPSTGARFIPVYLSSYNKVVDMFPPFLKATTSYGFSVPKKINELLCRLLQVKKRGLKKSEDRIVKDRLFQEELRESSHGFMSPKHKACNIEHCNKGIKHISHTNLSSIWATTVYTKWKSSESLDEDNNDVILADELDEMKNLQYQKALHYVKNMSDSIDELPLEIDKIPDAFYREQYNITSITKNDIKRQNNKINDVTDISDIKNGKKCSSDVKDMTDCDNYIHMEDDKKDDTILEKCYDVKYGDKTFEKISNIDVSMENGINMDKISDVISENGIDVKNCDHTTELINDEIVSSKEELVPETDNISHDIKFNKKSKYKDSSSEEQSLLESLSDNYIIKT